MMCSEQISVEAYRYQKSRKLVKTFERHRQSNIVAYFFWPSLYFNCNWTV